MAFREGLRQDEITKMARTVQLHVADGASVDEAWNAARKLPRGVNPSILEGFKDHVIELSGKLDAAPMPHRPGENVFTKVEQLAEDNHHLKKAHAEKDAELAELRAKLAQFNQENASLREENEALILGENQPKGKKG